MDDQIFGDPDAADIVFTSGADVLAVGINVTHQVVLTGNTFCATHMLIRGALVYSVIVYGLLVYPSSSG